MTELTWKRAGVGLGIFADGANHRYSVYRYAYRNYVVKIQRLVDGKPQNTGVRYEEHNPSQAFAKQSAEKMEASR